MPKASRVLALAAVLSLGTKVNGQDAQRLVEQAVQTELAANQADHTKWLYYEVERKPNHTAKQWVAETSNGDLQRVMEDNGKLLPEAEQRSRMESFAQDSGAQAKQRKADQHDDRQTTEMLNMLPRAFIWTKTAGQGNDSVLHFKPNPQFHPPNYEARAFAAMEGDMTIDDTQHRIVSLNGRMIRDVTFGGGFLGRLQAGGSFEVERREIGKNEWQITETHVHIRGRVLLFRNISEQEDDQKSKFKQLPGNESFKEAEQQLLQQRE
ncbi:MAG TPA: hypothetical protein VH308_09430 [Terracidiphilus sp.]|nr:hypothetical protein [Terracidiphilus sp.]